VVVRTAWETAKGSLVRSIMFPRPHAYTFGRDACKFTGIMGVLGAPPLLLPYVWC
jgi:cation-transporting ATPase 13A3/4/5